MELLRQWLLGVIACALIVSLAEQLCPQGAARQAVRFTGGLLLLLAMLRPIADIRLTDAAWNEADYREAVAALELELDRERENTLGDGIAAELEAYIEDKAEGLGTNVRATVTVETHGGVPLPGQVTLRGAYHEGLSALIASELGIAKEDQIWIEGG